MVIDSKQRNEVTSNLKTSFFVDAGAGAGKTKLMVDRIVSLIKSGVKPSEIVVITFTIAAAAELQDRVAKSIRKEKLEDVRIDELNISTIHSFCNKLISMRSFDEDIGLSRSVIDDAEEKQMVESFVIDYIAQHYDDPDLDELEAFWGNLPKRMIIDKVIDFAEKEDAKYILDPTYVDRSYADYAAEALSKLPEILDAYNKVVESFQNEGIEHNDRKYSYKPTGHFGSNGIEADLLSLLNETISNKNDKNAIGIVASTLVDHFSKQFKKPSSWDKAQKEAFAETVFGEYNDQIIEIQGEFKDRFDVTKYSKIVRLSDKIAKCYREDPNRDPRLLTNDSLLNVARKLTNNREALEFFQERFKYFLVDEYQDTDDVQTDIIWNLASDPDNKDSLRPGALVVVGDIKQSIYRFRGADSKLFGKTQARFQEIKDKGGEGVELVSLTTNFRSNEKIIDWVNDTFKDRFTALGEKYTLMNVDEQRRAYSDPDLLEGVFNGVDGEYLIEIIQKLTDKDSGFKIAQKEKIDGKDEPVFTSRKIEYKDIMILAFSKTNLFLLSNRLRRSGIPVDLTGGKDLNDPFINDQEKGLAEDLNEAVGKFKVLMDYLNTPYNKKKKAIAIQELSGSRDYLAMEASVREEYEKLLKGLRNRFKGMQPVQVMGYCFKHFEILLPQGRKREDYRYNGNREKFNKLYETLLAENCQSYEETITVINKFLNGKAEKQASFNPEKNAVKIMNLHQAKGLEAPITILINRGNEIKDSNVTFRDGNDYYVSFRSVNSYVPTYKFNPDIVVKAEQEYLKDCLTQAYVEMTRAREVMIIMPSSDTSVIADAELGLDKITDVLGISEASETPAASDGASVTETDASAAAAGTGSPEAEEPEVPTAENPADDLLEGNPDIKNKRYLTLNPSALETRNKDEKEDLTRAKCVTGAVFGTVMHRCYELTVDRRNLISSLSEEDRNTELRKIVIQAFMESERKILSGVYAGTSSETREQIQKEYLDYLVSKMKDFTESSLFTDVICSPENEAHTEYHFSLFLDKEQANDLIKEIGVNDYKKLKEFAVFDFDKGKLWINGTADLVIIGKDKKSVLIVDYKSDVQVTSEGKSFEQILSERYGGQLKLYKGSLKRVLGVDESVIKTGLYSLYETKTSFMDRVG